MQALHYAMQVKKRLHDQTAFISWTDMDSPSCRQLMYTCINILSPPFPFLKRDVYQSILYICVKNSYMFELTECQIRVKLKQDDMSLIQMHKFNSIHVLLNIRACVSRISHFYITSHPILNEQLTDDSLQNLFIPREFLNCKTNTVNNLEKM